MNYTDVFSGETVDPASNSSSSITVSSNVILNWASDFANYPNPMTKYIYFSTPNVGLSVTLPNATLAAAGSSSKFINNGPNDVLIKDFGGTTIYTLEVSLAVEVALKENSTSAGEWQIFLNPTGGTAVTGIDATEPAKGFSISGVPIGPGSGTIVFELTTTLDSLETIGTGATGGLIAKTAEDTVALRTLTSGNTNIEVTNGNGVSGNPTVTMNEDLTGLTTVEVGNLTLEDNKITSTGAAFEVFTNGEGSVTDSKIAIKDNSSGFKVILDVEEASLTKNSTYRFKNPRNDNPSNNVVYANSAGFDTPIELNVSLYNYNCVPGALIIFDATTVGTPTILASRNIDALTVLGTGSFEITFLNPFILSALDEFNTIGFSGYNRAAIVGSQYLANNYFTIVDASTVRVQTLSTASNTNFSYNCFIFYGILGVF